MNCTVSKMRRIETIKRIHFHKWTLFVTRFAFFVFAIVTLVFPIQSTAKTTFTPDISTLPAGITIPTDQGKILETQFQDTADKNGPALANANAFANTLGYAIGRSTLGSFPHFELGFDLNAGLSNMDNFRHSSTGVYNGSLPGIGLAPNIHFGIGLFNGWDFLGKVFIYNLDLYDPSFGKSIIDLQKFSIYSIGGRLRYNVVKEKTIIPFLLKFGGITFIGGADIFRGLVTIGGDYSKSFGEISVDQTVLPSPPADPQFSVHPTLDGTYTAGVEWYQMSVSTQAVSYFHVLSLFSIFTGFGLNAGYGWFTMNFDSTGTLSVADSDTSFIAATGGSEIGTVAFTSKNKYHPYAVIPTYLIGLELDIPLIKIVTETQVNLRNRADVSVTLGVRVQI